MISSFICTVNFFFIFFLLSLCISLSIVSTNYDDSSWLNLSWSQKNSNFFGIFGSNISESLFFLFGKVTYLILLILIIINIKYFYIFYLKNTLSIFNKLKIYFLNVRRIILIILLFCYLFNKLFTENDNFYYPPGGIMGIILSDFIDLMIKNINKYLIF